MFTIPTAFYVTTMKMLSGTHQPDATFVSPFISFTLSGRFAVPDFVTNWINVRAVLLPQIWKIREVATVS